MKIYGKVTNEADLKYIISSNVTRMAAKIKEENSKAIIINYGMKISDLFSLKKESPLYFFISENYPNIKNEFINETSINDFVQTANQTLGIEILEQEMQYEKIFRTIIAISDQVITNMNIMSVINIFQKTPKEVQLVLNGFKRIDIQLSSNLKLFWLLQDVRGIAINLVELLIIDQNDDFIEIESLDSFINYLELKSRTVLSTNDINNYFNGVLNFNSFLIEKALKTIKLS